MATVKFTFDARNQSKGEGSVKFRLIHNRQNRYYTCNLIISEEAFEKLNRYHRGNRRLKDDELISIYEKQILPVYEKMQAIIENLGDKFSFEAFRDAYDAFGKEVISEEDDVLQALVSRASQLRATGKISDAKTHDLTAKSIKRFMDDVTDSQRKDLGLPVQSRRKKIAQPEPILRFSHVTPAFLNEYERWMLERGKAPKCAGKPHTPTSETTVGFYLLRLRVVFNQAIEAGVIDRSAYPFGKNRYIAPQGQNIKKALSKVDIQKIITYKAIPSTMAQRSRDIFVLSYLTNGVNISDLCRLRWKDIEGDTLTFIRQKTARSRKGNQVKILAKLFPESWEIIKRWSIVERYPERYVFPFLNDQMDETRKIRSIHQVVKITNANQELNSG